MAAEQISEIDARSLDSLSSRYTVRSIIGRGASSTVYLADDLDAGRPVVIKMLSETADSDAAAARFRTEVDAARQLDHKNIARFLDYSITPGRRPCLVSEWIEGRSLHGVLRDGGRLEVAHAVEVAIGIARALAYVHRKGIVHRDLKPSNVFIPGWPKAPDYEGSKLLDFGVAGRLEQGRTQAGMIYGTLRYMSPEQIKGEQQSAATDVYGFGLLLYEMLAGSAPAKREQDLTTLLIAIRDGISDEDLKPLQPDLAGLIRRCLRTDPAERPPMAVILNELENSQHRSAGKTLGAFTSIMPAAPAAATPIPPPAPAASHGPSLTERTLVLDSDPPRSASAALPGAPPTFASRNWIRLTVLAAATAVLAIAVILFFRPAPATPTPEQNKTLAPAAPGPATQSTSAPAGSRETTIRALRFTAGLLLMATSIAIGFSLRTWLGSRSQVKSEAYELVFGARERTDLTATIALQLDDLVSKLKGIDERILAGSVALMLNEYGSATDTKDRQAALMNVVALSEKLAVRLSPWYERYKEIIASAVAVMGGVSGLMTAINSVLAHKH